MKLKLLPQNKHDIDSIAIGANITADMNFTLKKHSQASTTKTFYSNMSYYMLTA